ncbi:hypothetical protein C2845_PM11G28900 [Panicum miliaceum]|uniref:Uncharacterized protein n=1 Tax=Panicum miliaceum TaxID=4540 RepID=A0A3L6RQL4_PANMI|nr:hypothetical protein C2845_PM11G28900 [Panicum miliaceum]
MEERPAAEEGGAAPLVLLRCAAATVRYGEQAGTGEAAVAGGANGGVVGPARRSGRSLFRLIWRKREDSGWGSAPQCILFYAKEYCYPVPSADSLKFCQAMTANFEQKMPQNGNSISRLENSDRPKQGNSLHLGPPRVARR